VVVSPDPSPPETIERTSLTGEPTPPRNSTLSRLRSGPKDTIPVKPPRKQRSSRFVITEKVEIEKLPPFMGPSRAYIVARNFRELTLLAQKRRLLSVHNFFSRNFTNARSFSILMTPTPN